MVQAVATPRPFQMLVDLGVPRDAAYSLADEYDDERIAQSIRHFQVVAAIRDLDPGWIVHCLRNDWLPHPLFKNDPPPDRDSLNRRSNLLLARSQDYLQAVQSCVTALTRFEWEGLTAVVVRDEDDDWYKR